jgi:glycosyltransferase involved in cell wall biosynthesis
MSELARAACLFLPSFQETAPMVISEAMAAGLPVAASRICGIPWMVADGTTGHLFDPHDSARMTECLLRLLTDDDFRDRAGRQARLEANRRFRSDVIAQRTLEVYQLAIDGAPSRRA